MLLKRCGELQPGMVIAKDVHTKAGLLLINSGEEVTADSIEKLKNNSVSFVFIKAKKDFEKEEKPVVSYSDERYSYYERVQQSPDYKLFRGKFSSGVVKLRGALNRIVDGNPEADLETTAMKIMGDLIMPEGSIPTFDLLSNLRRFDDVCFVHSLNVAMLAGLLAQWIGCSPKEIAIAQECGLYHDIGKLTIPSEIVTKPSKYTDEEFEVMKNHPIAGYEILKEMKANPHVLNSALQHHQKLDGSGYPRPFDPKRIDPYARIIMLVDIYDAITSARAYRGMVCPFKVIKMFEDDGIQKYDAGMYTVFLEHIADNFIGTRVMLSDGREAKVLMTNKAYLSRPMVVSGSEFIDLSKRKDLYIDEVI
ncbi:MAG: HD-GYP domain-containing protein [Catonella sp.]|uniref:HD-GYP domain-containing protein n=1 Tax=Catonella sp. TaxID=2382125 RepID=UPI003F9FF287